MNKPGNLRALATAVQFLTRIPVPGGNHPASRAVLCRAVVFFPLVGSLIGCVTALIFMAGLFIWPAWLAVIIALAAETLITGGFHEDAVADFFDAFGGGWTREDTLRILKDSRVGSYGVIALFMGLALRSGGIVAIDPNHCFIAIIASATIGRWIIIPAMSLVAPVPHRDSIAKDVGQQTNLKEILTASLFALPGTVLWAIKMPVHSIIAGIVLIITLVIFTRLIKKRIGGVTGDCLGTICYVAQVIVLLVAAADWNIPL